MNDEDFLFLPLEERGFASLERLVAQFAAQGDEAFCEQELAGHAVLVVPGDAEENSQIVEAEILYQGTMDEGGESNKLGLYRDTAAILRKRPGNPFPQMISVGRARNCDVVLLLPTVSKIHGYFLRQGEDWLLVDQRSKNGITVNGRRLDPGEKCAVNQGDIPKFGLHLSLVFNLPGQFCELLRARHP